MPRRQYDCDGRKHDAGQRPGDLMEMIDEGRVQRDYGSGDGLPGGECPSDEGRQEAREGLHISAIEPGEDQGEAQKPGGIKTRGSRKISKAENEQFLRMLSRVSIDGEPLNWNVYAAITGAEIARARLIFLGISRPSRLECRMVQLELGMVAPLSAHINVRLIE